MTNNYLENHQKINNMEEKIVTINVCDITKGAMTIQQAKLLKEKLDHYISLNKSIILDFSQVEHFSALFFNHSVCKILYEIGKEKYDTLIHIINLPEHAAGLYQLCYNDVIDNPFENLTKKEIQELSNKLLNTGEEDDYD